MPNLTLYDDGVHRNILLQEFNDGGLAVQSNQHVVAHGKVGLILDPGGHKIYSKVRSEAFSVMQGGDIQHIFLSHQDPDCVAAVNGWLMTTDANAYISGLWTRFVAHFGVDSLVADRLLSLPDEGGWIDLGGGSKVMVIPAHFMHSEGNFQIYDPISKILYSGDLGASVGLDYKVVTNWDDHLKNHMEGFHKRYMVSNSINRAWAKMIRQLDIEIIAPQHGALFKGKDMVNRFIDWVEGLECGIDLIIPKFKLPAE